MRPPGGGAAKIQIQQDPGGRGPGHLSNDLVAPDEGMRAVGLAGASGKAEKNDGPARMDRAGPGVQISMRGSPLPPLWRQGAVPLSRYFAGAPFSNVRTAERGQQDWGNACGQYAACATPWRTVLFQPCKRPRTTSRYRRRNPRQRGYGNCWQERHHTGL